MRVIIARTHLQKMRTDSGPLAGKSSFGDGVKGDGTAWVRIFLELRIALPAAVRTGTKRPDGRDAGKLVPRVRRNRKVKAGFRKVVFEVRERIAVIVTSRGGIKKLSREHAAITKTKV